MKNKLPVFLALLLVLLVGAPIVLHAAAPTRDDYVIGPGDVVNLRVWGTENIDGDREVSSDGTIVVFFAGEVKIGGLTVIQARRKIVERLADGYLKNPVVQLRVTQYKSKTVTIIGAVNHPGSYALETNSITLLNLIAMAGGPTDNFGDEAKVFRGGALATGSGKSQPPEKITDNLDDGADQKNYELASLSKLYEMGDISQNLTIMPNDLVVILPKKDINYIYVQGAVNSPQEIAYLEGMTALKAVIRAGGFSDVSAPNRSTITRKEPDGSTTIIKVRLKDVRKGRREDIPLKPGDVITVPDSIF